eukprot:COSAG06_NODE_37467_length_434_cov_325.862687_1_plen_144_part_11
MKADALRKELKKRKLDQEGKKHELQERLAVDFDSKNARDHLEKVGAEFVELDAEGLIAELKTREVDEEMLDGKTLDEHWTAETEGRALWELQALLAVTIDGVRPDAMANMTKKELKKYNKMSPKALRKALKKQNIDITGLGTKE